MRYAMQGMNDFPYIRDDVGVFTPNASIKLHGQFRTTLVSSWCLTLLHSWLSLLAVGNRTIAEHYATKLLLGKFQSKRLKPLPHAAVQVVKEPLLKFIDNDHLAWLILEYVADRYPPYTSEISIASVLEWLKLSSSVDAVTIDTTKYDDCLAYCGKAWDYEEAKSELMSSLTAELVRFHFAWGALESLLAEFVPQANIKKFGKINALCGYLKSSKLEGLLPNGYLDECDHLYELMQEIGQYKKNNALALPEKGKQSRKDHIDITGVGVYSVYMVRNNFAHGSMTFPEPEDYGEGAKSNKELIVVSTRIVLMTMIMLLINDIKNDDFALNPGLFDSIKLFAFDSYENSLIDLLDNTCSDNRKTTAIRSLRQLCIYRA